MRIADGNTSDISLSDDEEGDQQPTQTDNQPDVAAGPSSPVDENDNNDGESTAKTRVSCTAKDFVRPDTTFQCEYDDPVAVTEPIEYFLKYISEEVFEEMARCTNIYVIETTGTILATTPDEVPWCSDCNGNPEISAMRMYWQPATQIPTFCEAMSVNRFFKLRSALHVTESTTPHSSADKFWKVRPLLNAVKERVLQLPPLEHNSIDEQIIPFTGRVAAKQFIRNKPNPEGVKVLLRCSAEGMAHDFELYQGKGTGVSEEHKSLGLGGSIVMRLVKDLPLYRNFKCCVLKTDKELRRKGRGRYDQKVTKDGDVILVRWQDNGVVNVASSYVGVDDLSTARRWSEATKQHVDIPCPALIKDYNTFMAGVDRMDFLLSLYPLRQRTKKWPVRVICHFVSFAIVNSWLEYVKHAEANRMQRKNTLDLLAFQNEVAMALIMCSKNVAKKRGRPSLQAPSEPPPRKVHNAEPRPVNAVRYDGLNHSAQPFAQRCKFEGCTSRTRIRCQKCNVFLCLSATENCFYAFHNK
ncbi:hypothetical protein HPB51_005661 [Rhipicephalus microplus]|uniref:PiggyBac transposable element-derived protein domain-containing protein n=1 Tax=Rhipicephalus microplus TaxID=6941 RepID=A0A9J6EY26_RHIMP|nr:hypothetical protein HPB51_005661 [Rhipicephalus microplus]